MRRTKRPRLWWRRQRELVKAWLRQEGATGYSKTWRATALSFEGETLYTHDNWSQFNPRRPLARLVYVKGRMVVCVQESDVRSVREMANNWRRENVMKAGAGDFGEVRVKVGALEDVTAQQGWHTARVQAAFGRWRRARGYKGWRMMQLETVLLERGRYEQAFGMKRTVEEPEVRAARVMMRLTR